LIHNIIKNLEDFFVSDKTINDIIFVFRCQMFQNPFIQNILFFHCSNTIQEDFGEFFWSDARRNIFFWW
jgi:hypothetical protein